MYIVLVAYLIWIVLIIGLAGLFLHFLHLDRPRPLHIPIRVERERH